MKIEYYNIWDKLLPETVGEMTITISYRLPTLVYLLTISKIAEHD